MSKFELLLKEVKDICTTNKIQFDWTHDVRIGCYRFRFREKDRRFSMAISEMDLAYKSFAIIKAELEHVVRLFKSNK